MYENSSLHKQDGGVETVSPNLIRMADISSNNKRIAKNTVFLYLRMLFILLVSLYTSRVVLNVLGVVDYGIYNVVAGFVTMFAFINSSLTACIQRFYNYENGRRGTDGIRTVYSLSCIIQIILALVVLLTVETVGLWYLNNKMVIPENRLFSANILFQCAVFSLISVIIQVPYSASIIAKERMDYYAIVGIIDVILKLLIVIILPYLPYDKLISYSSLLVITAIVDFLLYFVYAKVHFKELAFCKDFSYSLFRDMMSFSGWNTIGAMAMVARNQGLNLILNLFFGPTVNAARGVAFQVQSAITSFIHNIYTAVRPQLTESYAKGEIDRSVSLVYASSKVCFYVLLVLALPVSFRIDYLLGLWLGDTIPEFSGLFTVIVLIQSLVDILNTPITLITMASGKQIKKYCLVSSLLGLAVLPIAYVGLKLGAPPVFVFVAGVLISIFVQIACVRIMYGIISIPVKEYYKNVLAYILPVFLLSLITPYIANAVLPVNFIGFIILFASSFISLFVIAYVLGLNNREKSFCIEYIKRLIYKGKKP